MPPLARTHAQGLVDEYKAAETDDYVSWGGGGGAPLPGGVGGSASEGSVSTGDMRDPSRGRALLEKTSDATSAGAGSAIVR